MTEKIKVIRPLQQPGSKLITMAAVIEKTRPVMPINDFTLSERTAAFAEATTKAKENKTGNFVTPSTAETLAAMYGRDVLQKALDDGVIAIG